jgi:hypothetical protein
MVACCWLRRWFAALALVLGAGVAASAADIYSMSGIKVDATAANAQAAQDQALVEGQQRALRLLLERLTSDVDHARLPAPSPAEVEALVASFEVADEKRSIARYLATLTINFRADAVRDLLARAGIGFVESASEAVLVLPVYQEAQGLSRLWGDPNPWREAWTRIDPSSGLVPILVPYGELADVEAIDVDAALAGDPGRIGAISARYDAAGALVAIARAVPEPGIVAVDLEIRRFGSASGPIMVERISGEAGETFDRMLERAARTAVSRLDAEWKTANLVSNQQPGQIEVETAIAGLENWLTIRRRLENTPRVRALQVIELRRQSARLSLDYVGDIESLRALLGQRGLLLEDQFGSWTLTDQSPAAAAMAPPNYLPATDLPATDLPATAPAPAPVDDLLVE